MRRKPHVPQPPRMETTSREFIVAFVSIMAQVMLLTSAITLIIFEMYKWAYKP